MSGTKGEGRENATSQSQSRSTADMGSWHLCSKMVLTDTRKNSISQSGKVQP